ncbi:MAG: type VI secretion system membrane subunit TssM [Pseudomonadota bacterium]
MHLLGYISYIQAATSLGGVFMLAMVIWFFGPSIGTDGFYPLESALNRLIAIGVLAIAVIGWLLYKAVKNWRASKSLEEGITAPISDDGAVLAERMKDALGTLKKASGRKADYLYSIPWYIIIGPSGAGKTTALINSGLKFPLLSGGGKVTVEGVGGTRYCDWWFAEDAVLIDTAGRYTTQDSGTDGEANLDRRSWIAFLDLLRKNRARQPINGVILAFGVDDLITMSEQERNAHADAIRSRLVELHEKLKVAFPVYVMFTKADLVQGFGEFFGDLREKERQIVWGATFQTDERTKNTITEVPSEFDDLVLRLSENTIDRLQAEPNQARRSLILGFPAQFNALRDPAIQFLSRIFEPTRYQANAILRGFYFSSGTQEGTALDQLIGATSRVLGEEAPAPALSGKGRSFFLTNLLTKVIFGEAGWVSYNRARIRRERAMRIAGFAVIGLVTALSLGALGYSFAANRSLIANVDDAVEEYRVGAAGLLDAREVSSPDLAEAHSRLLWPLRTLPVGYAEREAAIPAYEGFGLSQRGRLTSAAEEAYYRALERSFRSRLVLRVEEVLAANLDKPQVVYETLKVYRMLTGENTDREVIVDWVVRDWEENVYAGRLNAGGRAALRDHLLAMLDLDFGRPVTISRNAPLVTDAESVLARVPLVDLAFARLALDASADPTLFDFVVEDEAGSDAARVFRTQDGRELSDLVIPSFFTRAGFQRALINRLPTIEAEIAAEEWLFGEAANQRAVQDQYQTLQQDLLRRYQDRYTETWQQLLDTLRLTPMAVDKPRYVALRALSSPASPLRQLLQAVSGETRLTEVDEEAAGETEVASDGAAQLTIRADLDNRASVRETVQSEPGAAVEAAFAPLHELMAADVEPSLGPIIASLSEIHDRLINLAGGTANSEADEAALLEKVAALKADAARLPEPASRLVLEAVGDIEADMRGERVTRVSQLFNQAITRQCEAIVSNRFPFVNSERDVTLGDFATLFKPDGLFDAFRKENLDAYIDKSGETWRWTPDVELSERTLRAFQNAAEITETFFKPGEDTPSFEIIVTTRALDPTASSGVLRINRTFVHASRVVHSQPVSWPGQNADNRAVVSVTYGPQARTERIAEQGPWALFRLVREGRAVAQDGRLVVDFIVGGRRLSFAFTSNTGPNPLTLEALTAFRCPTEL